MKRIKYDFHPVVQKSLSVLETVIGIILTIAVIFSVAGLAIISHPMDLVEHPERISDFLHIATTVVVAIEFINILVTHSMGSVLEMMIMLIARQMIVDHGTPLENMIFCLCMAVLFFIRKFLFVPHDDEQDHDSLLHHVAPHLRKAKQDAEKQEDSH